MNMVFVTVLKMQVSKLITSESESIARLIKLQTQELEFSTGVYYHSLPL